MPESRITARDIGQDGLAACLENRMTARDIEK